MHCIKKLFGCFEKNLTRKKSGKNLVKLNAFSHWNSKVIALYSSVCEMEENNILDPPQVLNGMKTLNRDFFKKTITVSYLVLENEKTLQNVLKILTKYLLRMCRLKGVLTCDENKFKVLLNPTVIKTWNDFDESIRVKLKDFNISEGNFLKESLELNYDNWSAEPLIKAALPKDIYPLTAFSQIGHIIHLNLKDHCLDYKYTIADILLDKIFHAKTVVYKKDFISSVYRNFEMVLIRGEPNYMVKVKEGGCSYEFDFSKVYWNPRLSTEHARIIEMLEFRDMVFDVFAGVGPFALPAAKKGCLVYANDLNPDAYKWLNHNISLNKGKKDWKIETFNKDGKDFILNDVRENILKEWQDDLHNKIHIVMNLPKIAPTFMKYFKGLFTKTDLTNLDLEKVEKRLPVVHCYFFLSRSENEKEFFERESEMSIDEMEHKFHVVRKVSNQSVMYRITLVLTKEFLFGESSESENWEPSAKRLCEG